MYSSPGGYPTPRNEYRNLLSLLPRDLIITVGGRRYNRNTTITNSELTQIGDSPIALWGYTQGGDPLQPAGTGIDGSKGLQPRGVDITRNLCHEYGKCSSLPLRLLPPKPHRSLLHPLCALRQPHGSFLLPGYHQKQSSCVFIAKSMFVNVVENVAFNGPRAHVNQNDALGMGHLMARNVMWNSCRESSDHGVFNSVIPGPSIQDCLTGQSLGGFD